MASDACRTADGDLRTTLRPSAPAPSASNRALNVTARPEPVAVSTLALTAAGSAPVPRTLAVSVQAQPSTMHASAAPPNIFRDRLFREEFRRSTAARRTPVLLFIRLASRMIHFVPLEKSAVPRNTKVPPQHLA